MLDSKCIEPAWRNWQVTIGEIFCKKSAGALNISDEPVNPSLEGMNAYFQTNWRRAVDPRFDSCKNTKTFTITRRTNITLTSPSLQKHTLEEATSSLRAADVYSVMLEAHAALSRSSYSKLLFVGDPVKSGRRSDVNVRSSEWHYDKGVWDVYLLRSRRWP